MMKTQSERNPQFASTSLADFKCVGESGAKAILANCSTQILLSEPKQEGVINIDDNATGHKKPD